MKAAGGFSHSIAQSSFPLLLYVVECVLHVLDPFVLHNSFSFSNKSICYLLIKVNLRMSFNKHSVVTFNSDISNIKIIIIIFIFDIVITLFTSKKDHDMQIKRLFVFSFFLQNSSPFFRSSKIIFSLNLIIISCSSFSHSLSLSFFFSFI